MRGPLGTFALAFVAGIASELHGLGPVALATAGAAAWAFRDVRWLPGFPIAGALTLGIATAALRGAPPQFHAKPRIATVSGHVAGDIEALPYGSTFVLRRSGDDALLATEVNGPVPEAGDRLVVRGRLEPFDEPRNDGEPSPAALARERGLFGRLLHARILAHEPAAGFDLRDLIARGRAWASTTLRARLDPVSGEILAGAMWGERGDLPSDLRSEFQDTGTMHVLVTAGLHLGVVAGLAAVLLAACGVGRVPGSLTAIVVVWAYAVFSGAHLPAVRAATMASFALLARACGRAVFSWNAFGAALIVVTALWPWSVDSVSFALSFSCVGAILLLAGPLAKACEHARLPPLASEAVALTVATQLGTWPLTAATFLVFAPYAPLANVAVVPTVGVAMLLGFATLAATPLPTLAQLLANLEQTVVDWIVGVVRTVASLPAAHVVTTPPPMWTIALYDVALVVSVVLVRHGRSWAATTIFMGAVALALWPPRSHAEGVVVTAIDVGQADALLIQTPRGHAYLVDAGGRLEHGPSIGGESPAEAIGDRIVVPFLVRHGIHRLDGILASHPHGDHVGGMPPVLRLLGAGLFADSGQTYPGHAYHDALAVVHARHVPTLYPHGGDVWRTDDGVTFRFYGPTLPLLANTRNDINNNSLVFRLEYGHFRMLFTGDAGAEAEQRILASGADVSADVLKVGHHGSAYSSTPEFIRAVSPRYAIVSVGRNNLFGHPAPSTIETLAHAGVDVYRTDIDGAVNIRTDGERTAVSSLLMHDRPASETGP